MKRPWGRRTPCRWKSASPSLRGNSATYWSSRYRDFGTDAQQAIRRATPDQAEVLIREGHFAPGSMLPKIEAAIRFARPPGRRAVICDPASALDAIEGRAGTTIAFT